MPAGSAGGEDAGADAAATEDAAPEAGARDAGGADAGGGDASTADASGDATDSGAADAQPIDAAGGDGASGDAAVTPTALVSHSGRWLIDAEGRVLIVHGFNVVNKVAPYTPEGWGFDDDDAAFLQANGFNAVRLGVIWEAVEPQPGTYDAAYVAQIRATEQMLAAHGIYTLIDWHQDEYSEMFGGEGFPAWAVNTGGLAPASPHDSFPNEYSNDPAEKAAWDNLYADVLDAGQEGGAIGPQERLAAAEAYVAAQFVGDPWVLGYDVINEPSAGSASEPAADESAIGPLEQKLMKSIRGVDEQHLLFYEPTSTFGLNGINLPPTGDLRAGISFHDYCFEPGSMAQSVYALLCGGVLNSSQTTAASHASSATDAGSDAVLMTEFGSATPYAVQMVADDADQNMIPWLNWAYCGCGDPTTALNPAEEGIVVDPSQPLSGSNINSADLAVLERPYPQAIAGTPTSWSYNETTGGFTLGYSALSPPGAILTAGANTLLFLPPLQYPSGYTVTVTGGTVVAGNGTPSVEIATSLGATSVVVSVTKL